MRISDWSADVCSSDLPEHTTMKKLILTLIAALGIVAGAHAAEGGIAWDKAPNKTNDLAALQNGAKLFVNYCLNCHSAAFMRYNRLQDIGIKRGRETCRDRVCQYV